MGCGVFTPPPPSGCYDPRLPLWHRTAGLDWQESRRNVALLGFGGPVFRRERWKEHDAGWRDGRVGGFEFSWSGVKGPNLTISGKTLHETTVSPLTGGLNTSQNWF